MESPHLFTDIIHMGKTMNKSIKITVLLTSALLATGILAGCSNGTSNPSGYDPNANSDLPTTEVVDPSVNSLDSLVKNKTTGIKVGDVIKLNVPEKEYSTLQVVSSKPDVVSYKQGNVITEGNPMPTTPPSLSGLAVGESEITITDAEGKTYSFTVTVKE